MQRIISALVALLLGGVLASEARGEEDVFDRLAQVERFPEPIATKTAAERRLVRRARRAPVRRLIKRSVRDKRARRDYVPLRRSVERYVAAIVGDGGTSSRKLVGAGFVPCTTAVVGGSEAARCVAVVGDSCRTSKTGDCEGMHLAVVVRIDGKRVSLDRIVGGGYYVAQNQDDIEDLRDAAP